MSKFEVCQVEDKRKLLKKKLLANKSISGDNIKKVFSSFEDYDKAVEYQEEKTNSAIIVEVFQGEEPNERLVCEECEFTIHTNSSKRYTRIKKIHEKYHNNTNFFEEDEKEEEETTNVNEEDEKDEMDIIG